MAQPQQAVRHASKQASRVCINIQGAGIPEGFEQAVQNTANPTTGGIPLGHMQQFLQLVQLEVSNEQLQAALQHSSVCGGTKELSRDDVAVLCQILTGANGPLTAQPSQSLPGSNSISEMKKSYSKRRMEYMESGHLQTDDAVLAYIQRLDEHRKMCELTGRYAEAGAAAGRIQDLKTAQAERLRGELVELQHSELAHLQETYSQETQAFDQEWRSRITSYEAGVAAQLTALKSAHEAQMADFLLDSEARRPTKPKHSADYLNHRKIEEVLVKQGQYRKAHELKVAADAMFHTELASTHNSWGADVELRRTKLLAKQQNELDVVLQRAGRGRDELELRRLDEAGKRHNRFRCMVQELDSMHRLEVVHLENFLENQAAAGKYVPLRESNFRRKRELLGLS